MSRREEKRPIIYCVRIKNIRINIVIHFNIFTFHGTWGLSRNVCDIILWIIKPRDGLRTVELQGSSLDTFPSDWEVRIIQSSIPMAIITWISQRIHLRFLEHRSIFKLLLSSLYASHFILRWCLVEQNRQRSCTLPHCVIYLKVNRMRWIMSLSSHLPVPSMF